MVEPEKTKRRFPSPWTVIEIPGGFRVVDANGVAVAYVYCRDDLASSSGGSRWLTIDEARRIASGIARLPGLRQKVET